MKKILPPRPKTRSTMERHRPIVIQTFYGILYRFDINNKWENVVQDYCKIDLVDYECTENPYRLEAVSGNQKILNYIITSSTKASLKGAFVRWSHDTTIHGARFSKPNAAEEFYDQLCAFSMDQLSKLQGNAEKRGNDIGSRKASTASVNNNNPIASAQPKASAVLVELLINNSDLLQIYVDKETPVSGLFDKICKDENLNQSFHALNYISPANSPVPLGCQVANLDSYKLQIIANKDLQKSVGSDARITHPEGRLPAVQPGQPVREERRPSQSKDEKEFDLDATDPLVTAFLEIANIHQYELKKPPVHEIVEEFIASKGGLHYLKHLRDSKLSSKVLDEIGEISQRVLALAESPAKSSHQYKRINSVREVGSTSEEHFDLRRAYSVGNLSPTEEMEKKKSFPSKKKRQAPLPPGLVTARKISLPLRSSKDGRADLTKSAEVTDPPRVKRRAPLPPSALGKEGQGLPPPLQTAGNTNVTDEPIESVSPTSLPDGSKASRDSSVSPNDLNLVLKSPPSFSPPPPPNDSPPNEVYSPVGSFSATTPSPTKEFQFIGELAKKLGARRSLIVHSDDEDASGHPFTPKKENSGTSSDAPSENNISHRKGSTGESTPVKNVKDSQVKSAPKASHGSAITEDQSTPATMEQNMQSSDIITNGDFVAGEEKSPSIDKKVEKKKREGEPLQNTPRKESSEMSGGYTVQLLENQMKTISHSIRLLQDVKDSKQREVLLKPLLLQQTILQKMIDEERNNITDSVMIETDNQLNGVDEDMSRASVRSRTDNGNEGPSQFAVNGVESDVLNSREIGKEQNHDLTHKSRVIANDIDNKKEKAKEMEMRKNVEQEKLTREKEEEEKRQRDEEVQQRTVKEMQKKKEEERQQEIDQEKRRYEEQKRHMESEKRKKMELERQKKEKDSESEQIQLLRQREFLEQTQRMKEQRLDKEKKESEEQEREEEEKLRQEEVEKQEEYRKIEEEKKKAERQKQEIELARKEREEERIRLEEEMAKLRVEEMQRKEEEAKRKTEEVQELERLRKELEFQKQIENERLEKERKEIDELKKQLKEQRQLQEREALQRNTVEDKKLNVAEVQIKPNDERQQQVEFFDVVKEIELESESIVLRSSNDGSKPNDAYSNTHSEAKDTVAEDVVIREKIDAPNDLPHAFRTNRDPMSVESGQQPSASLPKVKPKPQSTTSAKSDGKHNGSMRRPSSNLVSSAIRTGEGETSKKSTVGLFAKIQQMANERSNASNLAGRNTEIFQKESKEKDCSNVSNQTPTSNSSKEKIQDVNSYQGTSALSSKDTRSGNTRSPISDKNSSVIVLDQQQGVRNKSDAQFRTKISSVEKNPETNALKDVNGIDRPDGGVVRSEYQEKRDGESIGSKAYLNKSNSKESELIGAEAASQAKENNDSLNVNRENVDSSLAKTTENEVNESHAEKKTEKKTEKETGEVASDVETFKTKGIYLSGFSSWSSSSASQKTGVNDGIGLPDDIGFNRQGSLGNYRPKCISPDELRSTSMFEKDNQVEANKDTASSASILRSTLGKKVPPKVLPKTLPKTLPKPSLKVIGTSSENAVSTESVKNRVGNFNRQTSETKEKKRDYINLAAIPNRSLEISSGTISSNIMNRNITHEDKKRGHVKSGEKGRMLPLLPTDDLKAEGSVESEPVHPPSLLRRASQSSPFADTTNLKISPMQIGSESNDKKLPGKILNTDKTNNETSEVVSYEATTNSEAADAVRIGNYASVVDVNENERVQRDTIPVKKVGGLNIGFGRDKPKVYNS